MCQGAERRFRRIWNLGRRATVRHAALIDEVFTGIPRPVV